MKATERIGVFICECGPNIKEAVDLAEVSRFAQSLENVVLVKPFGLLCSKEGKGLLAREIQDRNLSRVVIAACSPKEHEKTFQGALVEAGLNPFLLQIANIREQCAWVVNDRVRATEKAKVLLAAAVNRVMHHVPLERKEIDCLSDVLVVGAGVAGINAALTLAQKQRKVTLVEKLPCVGGKAARYEDLFPNLECASCVLDPLLDQVLHHDRVEVITLAQVQELLGFYGNFVATVHKKARYVDEATCIGCGACIEACPVRVRNEYNEGLDERKAIYIPYAGALPNVAVIDKEQCLRWRGKACSACRDACPFGSIRYEDEDRITEHPVGAVVLATGFDLFDPAQAPQYGYGKIPDVYTSLEFERLVNASGPTQGKIALKNGGAPQRIAFVHCVGSRTKRFYPHCSSVCCMYIGKFIHQALQKLPGVSIFTFFSDLCLPGKEGQGFFDAVSEEGDLTLIRLQASDSVEILKEGEQLTIGYTDVGGSTGTVVADMVVLAPAMIGARDADEVARVFGVCRDGGGFFVEDQATLAPVSTATEGIFIAGCAQGPKDIQGAVAQGQAAAGKILSRLVPGEKLTLEGTTAEVEQALCAGCKTCIGVCPYKAIRCDEETGCAVVNEVLCRGCGLCAAVCPSGAMHARHFTDEALSAEIRVLAAQAGERQRQP
jgi:heterodisulfide reductase subunit A